MYRRLHWEAWCSLHEAQKSVLGVDFADFALLSRSIQVVQSRRNAISTHLDDLYGQADTIYGIGMSVWSHAAQTDTISTPDDGV